MASSDPRSAALLASNALLFGTTWSLLHLSVLTPAQEHSHSISTALPEVPGPHQPHSILQSIHGCAVPTHLCALLWEAHLAFGTPCSVVQPFRERLPSSHHFLWVCLYFACFELSPLSSHQGTLATVHFSHSCGKVGKKTDWDCAGEKLSLIFSSLLSPL